VDVVVGTHRLLSRDVRFRDLGLVVIDEEQRFGVTHKERLKELRTQVDVLTLTATPIPRTLQMAMGGLREISIIATPPADRLAIRTFVCRWDPEVLGDYVSHGLKDHDGKRVLSFDRAVETAIYNTLPHNLGRLLSTHPLQCPAAFIGGRDSEEMKQVGMAMTLRITHGRTMMLDGSHLFPMEQPVATAAAIEASLLNLAALTA
jgi:pimeloyl-ACP methyl ester carboxylesterase